MVIRNGFVSNSSNTSFVICDPGLRTTAETAWAMLALMIEEWDDDPRTWPGAEEFYRKMNRAIEWLGEHLDFDDPITFPWSINEDTYIWNNSKGHICVDTCFNHPWADEIRYLYAGEDWKWEEGGHNYDYFGHGDTILMDRWHEVEYLNLDTMQKGLREGWAADEKRKKDAEKKGIRQ